jgi:hypothetical protein
MGWIDEARVAGWLPEGEQGTAKITRFCVNEDQVKIDYVQNLFNSDGRRCHPLKPDTEYTRLSIEGHGLVMSDTPQEVWEHSTAMHHGQGRVLVHGLGIAMVTAALLRKEAVEHITVVEINQDVIDLVAPHLVKEFGGDRLEIIHDNALTWKPKPKTYWDFIWHDIWPSITADNLPDMIKLHRRFGRRCGEQFSWARYHCEMQRDMEKRTAWNW